MTVTPDSHGYFFRMYPGENRAEVFYDQEWVSVDDLTEVVQYETLEYRYTFDPFARTIGCERIIGAPLDYSLSMINNYDRLDDDYLSPDAQNVSFGGNLLDRIDEALEDWGWVR